MDYSLAKRLKEAGFPQQDNSWYITDQGNRYKNKVGCGVREGCCIPSMDDVIDALGHDFLSVGKYVHSRNWPEPQWYAKQKVTGRRYIIVIGETPLIAVSNLYLKLHEKK